jgi:hypothetical protein
MSIASSQLSRRVAALLAGRRDAGSEVRHKEVIEATLDRAEAYARMGDFRRAVDWLDRADTAGDLPATYRARRARWSRNTSVAPR